ERVLSLQDNCAVEISFDYAKNNNYDRLDINLKDGKYSLVIHNDDDVTITKIADLNEQPVNNARPVKLKRSEGWTFSYVFDRKYTFYLCIDEFVFPTYESMRDRLTNPILQWCVLLDGEIVYNLL